MGQPRGGTVAGKDGRDIEEGGPGVDELGLDELSELEVRFSYHRPAEDERERYDALRAAAGSVATLVMGFCPPSRERSLALTKLEEAVFWANAAIARRE